MYNYDDAFDRFTKEMDDLGIPYDTASYHLVMHYLGPSVYSRDATFVACSDTNEMNYIREHFLIGKLDFDADDPRLNEALEKVCTAMGTSNTKKRRPTFYYLLMKELEADFNKLA
jgi:hypothetical protein